MINQHESSLNAPRNNNNKSATASTYNLSSSWLSNAQTSCGVIGCRKPVIHSKQPVSPLTPAPSLQWFPWWLCLACSLWVKWSASLHLGKGQLLLLLLLLRPLFRGFWDPLSFCTPVAGTESWQTLARRAVGAGVCQASPSRAGAELNPVKGED